MDANVLTLQHIQNAVSSFKENKQPFEANLFYIESRHFYLGELAKALHMDCSEEEIMNAREDGFIKNANGIDLYLSRLISVTS